MTHPHAPRHPRPEDGLILLEVMVATLVVALLMTALGTAFAGSIGRAREVRRTAEERARAVADDLGAGASWEWGPRVLAAVWGPGPVLKVRVAADSGSSLDDTRIGLWADGWLVAETAIHADSPAGPGDVRLGPELWGPLAGSELVIRVAAAAGSWGPPCRLAVPGSSGLDPGEGGVVGGPVAVQAGAGGAESRAAVVHRPTSGTSSLGVSWENAALTPPTFGLILPLSPPADGWAGATLDARSQWWWSEEGRDVDIFF